MATRGSHQRMSSPRAATAALYGVPPGKIIGDANGFLAPVNGLKYGFVNNRVTGFIQALETIGEVNVLASPRVLVLNKQRAEIQLGQRLGYATVTQNLTSTVQQIQFLNTGTLLRFRPFISNDGMIRLEVHPEKSTGVVANNLPSSNTSEVTTNVMVPDGATLVIGGLVENDDDSEQQGVLGLSRLPVVGPFFRAKQQASTKTELVVMLTPRIWNPANPQGAGSLPNQFCPPPMMGLADGPGATDSRRARSRRVRRSAIRRSAVPPLNPRATRVRQPRLRRPVRRGAGNGRACPDPDADPPGTRRLSGRGTGQDPGVLRASTETIESPSRQPAAEPDDGDGYPEHLVRRGETFQTIARLYYGSDRYEAALRAANRTRVASPDRLSLRHGYRRAPPRVHSADTQSLLAPSWPNTPLRLKP